MFQNDHSVCFCQINAREDIDVSQVGSARSAFKQMENRREAVSTVNKPRVNKIADPNSIMKERRNITYGYETEVSVYNVLDCSLVDLLFKEK